MKKCLIITTINKENESLNKFSQTDYDLIIVGDLKSPKDYKINCVYLDVNKQKEIYPKFSKKLPYNHYSRKNIGYLYAIKNGYDIIAESDDDNIPYDFWGKIPTDSKKTIISPQYPNIYKLFTNINMWPRGFPLNKILSNEEIETKERNNNVMIWQGLSDGNPDVDAIYRLTNNIDNIKFKENQIVLDKNILSPFNTQNTIWMNKKVFPFLYLPSTVSFRFTDILKSYVAQCYLWKINGRLGFTGPTAYQIRNEHNLMKDFEDEHEMHINFDKIMDIIFNINLSGTEQDLIIIYEELLKKKIVKKVELKCIEEWLKLI